MSSSQDLAAKIARLLETEKPQPDLSSIQASLDAMAARLEKLEAAGFSQAASQSLPSPHPSTDRFAIAEAIADEIFGKLQNEKACAFEPSGKPCDHCSMCSTRGF